MLLTDEELRRVALEHAKAFVDDGWEPNIQVVHNPSGAWVQFFHHIHHFEIELAINEIGEPDSPLREALIRIWLDGAHPRFET